MAQTFQNMLDEAKPMSRKEAKALKRYEAAINMADTERAIEEELNAEKKGIKRLNKLITREAAKGGYIKKYANGGSVRKARF